MNNKDQPPPYESTTAAVNTNLEIESIDDESDDSKEKISRGEWGGKIEFILTCVGFAVGLGNVWRFPYKCYKNGGGAFLIPYVIMLVVVGIPLFYLELCLGQFSSEGPITAWKVAPLLKGVGYAAVIVTTLISLYYNVIVAYCLYYLFASFAAEVPWAYCKNGNGTWASPNCRDSLAGKDNATGDASTPASALSSMAASTLSELVEMTTVNQKELVTAKRINPTTPSEDYLKNHILELTDSPEDLGHLKWDITLALFIAWLLCFLVLSKGVKTLGKVVYFSAIFPYIMLIALFIRGVTLTGAMEGITYYLRPDIDKLWNVEVWQEAAVQIFYSLGVAQASLIALASYNKFNNNTFRDAILIPVINCGTSVFAGLVIFSVLGYMAHIKNVEVKDVADEGPGLAFIVYPEGIAQMPLSPLWAVLFFFMMANLGFSSMFSVVETVLSAILDMYPQLRVKSPIMIFGKKRNIKVKELVFRAVFNFACFILGLSMCFQNGFYIVHLMDSRCASIPLLFLGCLECVTLAWVYGYEKLEIDITTMLGFHRWGQIYWRICWQIVTPITIVALLVISLVGHTELTLKLGGGEIVSYGEWAEILGWIFIALPLLVLIVVFFQQYFKVQKSEQTKSVKKIVRVGSQPTLDWGPVDPAQNVIWRQNSEIKLQQRNTKRQTSRENGTVAPATSAAIVADFNQAQAHSSRIVPDYNDGSPGATGGRGSHDNEAYIASKHDLVHSEHF